MSTRPTFRTGEKAPEVRMLPGFLKFMVHGFLSNSISKAVRAGNPCYNDWLERRPSETKASISLQNTYMKAPANDLINLTLEAWCILVRVTIRVETV